MKTYYSKRSFLLSIILNLLLIVPLFYHLFRGDKWVLILLFIALILMNILWFGTRYIIHQNYLTIYIGLKEFRSIRIEEIQSIRKCRSVSISPACSIDRIEIKYRGNKTILLSPRDKKAFIHELQNINPEIRLANLVTSGK